MDINCKNDSEKEGEGMVAIRKDSIIKDNIIKEETNYTQAKNEDVMKAIVESNKKHSKMMKMLSK